MARRGRSTRSGCSTLTAGLPEQVEDAAGRARGSGGFGDAASVEQIVVIGMGGSGIAGDVVAAIAAPMLPVPVLVVKSYECPAFVDSGSLVFAVSASGQYRGDPPSGDGCRRRQGRPWW